MDIVYITKYRYEIQEQELPVWCTDIYRPIFIPVVTLSFGTT